MTESSVAARQVIQALTSGRMWSRAEVLADPGVVPARAGIYGWYFRDVPAVVPIQGCVQREKFSLLYVGKAPRSASSKSTLQKRIVENHLNARRGLSTLRLTLALLLGLETRHTEGGKAVPTAQSQERLSEWLNHHARVVWAPIKAPWTLEWLVISQLRPSLNLAGNPTHPFHLPLKALRAAARSGRRGPHSERIAEARPMIEPLAIEMSVKTSTTTRSRRTTKERLRSMTEEEIEAVAKDDPDNPPTDREFWRDARTVGPGSPRWETVPLHIDVDLLEWFKARRFRYQDEINAALRAYMEAHRNED